MSKKCPRCKSIDIHITEYPIPTDSIATCYACGYADLVERFPEMTNRDLINAMSDEELADEFFSVANKRTGKNGYCRIYWQNPKPCRPWLKCNKCLLDWLKAPAGKHQEVENEH